MAHCSIHSSNSKKSYSSYFKLNISILMVNICIAMLHGNATLVRRLTIVSKEFYDIRLYESHGLQKFSWVGLERAPGRFAPKPVPPGTIPPGLFAQNFERDCSLQSSGTIRSKTNLRVDSPVFIILIKIHVLRYC